MTDVCPNCHAGALQPRLVTYAAWHTLKSSGQEQFVIVPRVPAWLCDVCEYRRFDIEAMERLALLIGPTADMDESAQMSFPRNERGLASFDGDLDLGRVQ
jgi:hypothetical protein